jgi:hypothetical protein
MPEYDSDRFHPPAAVAMVTIVAPASGSSVPNVPMLLDSGADVSLLPRSFVAQLIDGDEDLPQFELEAFDGSKCFASAAELELQFFGKSFRGQFLLQDGPIGILGRNVLNSVSVIFDGPALNWREHR